MNSVALSASKQLNLERGVVEILQTGRGGQAAAGRRAAWVTPQGRLELLSKAENQDILKNLGALELTGDSHNRYLFSYLLLSRDGNLQVICTFFDSL